MIEKIYHSCYNLPNICKNLNDVGRNVSVNEATIFD